MAAPFQCQGIVGKTHEQCQQVRNGVGATGDWTIDFPIRYDFPDALRLDGLIEPLNPLGAEDLVRPENPEVYRL